MSPVRPTERPGSKSEKLSFQSIDGNGHGLGKRGPCNLTVVVADSSQKYVGRGICDRTHIGQQTLFNGKLSVVGLWGGAKTLKIHYRLEVVWASDASAGSMLVCLSTSHQLVPDATNAAFGAKVDMSQSFVTCKYAKLICREPMFLLGFGWA